MSIWLRRLAFLAILGFPLAVLGTRLELFDFGFGFKLITLTVVLALVVFFVGLLTAYFLRKSNAKSSKVSSQAVLMSLIPVLGIGSQLLVASSLPKIHNISTDTIDPPQFNQVVALRGEESNPLTYDAAVLAPQQIQAYPEVKTLTSNLDAVAAHQRAVTVAESLGWEIVSSDTQNGIIEATETSTMWGFKDDIVIRLQEVNGGVDIDLRSVSRVGQSDLGVNAKRINAFLTEFDR